MTHYIQAGGHMVYCTEKSAIEHFHGCLRTGIAVHFLVKTAQLKIWVYAPKKRWYRDTYGKWKYRPIEHKFKIPF